MFILLWRYKCLLSRNSWTVNGQCVLVSYCRVGQLNLSLGVWCGSLKSEETGVALSTGARVLAPGPVYPQTLHPPFWAPQHFDPAWLLLPLNVSNIINFHFKTFLHHIELFTVDLYQYHTNILEAVVNARIIILILLYI